MSEKHPGPLVVEGKLTDAERMKLESNYLRGTIAEAVSYTHLTLPTNSLV